MKILHGFYFLENASSLGSYEICCRLCGHRGAVDEVLLHVNKHDKEKFFTLDKGEENMNEEENDENGNEEIITISDSDENEDEDKQEIEADEDDETENEDQNAIIEVSVTSDRGTDRRLTAAEQLLVDVMKERNEAAERAGHSVNRLAGLPGNTATPRRFCRIVNAQRPSPGCPGVKDTSRRVVCHICDKKIKASYINCHMRKVHCLKVKEWKQIYGDYPSM